MTINFGLVSKKFIYRFFISNTRQLTHTINIKKKSPNHVVYASKKKKKRQQRKYQSIHSDWVQKKTSGKAGYF